MILQIAAVFGMGLLASLGSYFLKRSTCDGLQFRAVFLSPWLYIGGVLYVASAGLNYYLLKLFPLSLVVPLGALTYLWTLLLSHFLLGESISSRKTIGICIIIAGVALVAVGSK